MLVRQPAEVYTVPAVPFPVDDLFDAEPPAFGRAMRRHFLVAWDEGWTFLNHGAFGAAAAAPFQVAQRWRAHCEAQPLRHFDRDLFPHVVHALRQVAPLLQAEAVDLVLTPNATTALNAVIFSAVPLAAGDSVFALSVGYGSVKAMLRQRCEDTGAEYVEAEVRFPLGDLVALVERTLPPTAKLAVFDWVTSNTALALPIAALVRACVAKCPGIRVLVDGAHALGAPPPLDVPALGCHFFVANCHKHLCSPRGAALLWTHPAARAALRPPVRSHGAGRGMLSDFIWDGNRDYAPWLALPHTLRWWRTVGGLEAGVAYMQAVLAAGVGALLLRWQTHTLVPLAECGNMVLVRLPCDDVAQPCVPPEGLEALPALLARAPPSQDGAAGSAHAKAWQEWLYERHIEVPVKCIQGHCYVRVTAHLYNDSADFALLAEAVAAQWASID